VQKNKYASILVKFVKSVTENQLTNIKAKYKNITGM